MREDSKGWGSHGAMDTLGSLLLNLLICYLTPVREFLHSTKDIRFLNSGMKTKLLLCLGINSNSSKNAKK